MYLALAVIVLCQIALAVGNYFLRPKPRPTAAVVMLILGFVLAAAVSAQFVVAKVRENEITNQLAAAKARTITPEQRARIVELLSPDRIVKGPILINTLMDGELSQFGESISSVLKEAGFNPTEVSFGQRLIGLSVPGAFIWIKNSKNQPKHAGPIFEAFKRAGIRLNPEEKPDAVYDTDTVEIAVGSHP